MKEDHHYHTQLLPHLFRQEYAKMTAVLCRHFGFEHMEIAEDIASETFEGLRKLGNTWHTGKADRVALYRGKKQGQRPY